MMKLTNTLASREVPVNHLTMIRRCFTHNSSRPNYQSSSILQLHLQPFIGGQNMCNQRRGCYMHGCYRPSLWSAFLYDALKSCLFINKL